MWEVPVSPKTVKSKIGGTLPSRETWYIIRVRCIDNTKIVAKAKDVVNWKSLCSILWHARGWWSVPTHMWKPVETVEQFLWCSLPHSLKRGSHSELETRLGRDFLGLLVFSPQCWGCQHVQLWPAFVFVCFCTWLLGFDLRSSCLCKQLFLPTEPSPQLTL